MRVNPLLTGCAVAIFVFYVAFYDLTPQESIVTFDKEIVQGQLIRQLAEIKLTEPQIEQTVKRFNEVLNRVLVDYAEQNKVVILRKKDVLAGGVDITKEVVLTVHKAMRDKA